MYFASTKAANSTIDAIEEPNLSPQHLEQLYELLKKMRLIFGSGR